MNKSTLAACQASYDRVAEEYTRRIYDELQHKPLDRQLLDQLVTRVGQLGPICDLGCGPGQVARYLHERGAAVLGVDLSPGMVEMAQRLNPTIPFYQGNMLALPFADERWGGIAAFYSLIHIPPADLPVALGEIRRLLRPAGWLLLAFHSGQQIVHLDEWWGEAVGVDFFFFDPTELMAHLDQTGFMEIGLTEREPYPEVEHQSRRAYLFARRPQQTQRINSCVKRTAGASI
jgi:SAM-dependent methyltransferase